MLLYNKKKPQGWKFRARPITCILVYPRDTRQVASLYLSIDYS